jgi:hypothetical protein
MLIPCVLAMAVLGGSGEDEAARAEAIAKARAALAAERGVKADAIEVAEAVPTLWPDSSLECGDRQRVFLPVVTPGYRVLLRVGGAIQAVHVGAGRAVVCGPPLAAAEQQPRPVVGAEEPEVPEPEAPAQKALVAQAREDLTRRLAPRADEIRLVKFKEVVWPDRGLGCPQPGIAYPQVPQDGVLIVLRAGGRSYDYHAGAGRAPFLCESPKPAGPR